MNERDELLRHIDLAFSAGLCVVPPKQDGSKKPFPVFWKKYQQVRPERVELYGWYEANQLTGIGYVCGAVSGNLEVVDFDDRATYDAYRELAELSGLSGLVDRIESGYLEETPHGVHWLYRCAEIAGNIRLFGS